MTTRETTSEMQHGLSQDSAHRATTLPLEITWMVIRALEPDNKEEIFPPWHIVTKTLLNLCLTSRALYHGASPLLYRNCVYLDCRWKVHLFSKLLSSPQSQASDWSVGRQCATHIRQMYCAPFRGLHPLKPLPDVEERRDSLNSPRKTLSSYSSADSLLRRTIKRASPRKSPRPLSPANGRTRPMSPLAGQVGQFDEDIADEESSQEKRSHPLYTYPSIAYPSRNPALDNSLVLVSSGNASASTAHSTLPMSMTMTSITSTVSVGSGSGASKLARKLGHEHHKEKKKHKTKGKKKSKEKESMAMASMPEPLTEASSSRELERERSRKRSSTVQIGALNSTMSLPPALLGQTLEDEREFRGSVSSDRTLPSNHPHSTANANPFGVGVGSQSDTGAERKRRPKMPKLSMSFAQVAARAPGSARPSVPTPAASSSTAEWESPRFAHPEDSE